MILMLTAFAGAADLTWSCPPITVAADAHPWTTPGDLGAINAGRSAAAYAASFVTDACRVECGSGCYQGECTADDGSLVTYDEEQGGDGADCYYVGTTIVVTRASGDWTRLSVDYGESSCGGPPGSGSGGASWLVSWDGALNPAWPSDSGFEAQWSWDYRDLTEIWTDPTCNWSSAYDEIHSYSDAPETWAISVAGTNVTVTADGECEALNASIDDGDPVLVDAATWVEVSNPCGTADSANGTPEHGCGCGTAAGRGGGWLSLLALLGVRRRRR
jgi:hypothetical protein